MDITFLIVPHLLHKTVLKQSFFSIPDHFAEVVCPHVASHSMALTPENVSPVEDTMAQEVLLSHLLIQDHQVGWSTVRDECVVSSIPEWSGRWVLTVSHGQSQTSPMVGGSGDLHRRKTNGRVYRRPGP